MNRRDPATILAAACPDGDPAYAGVAPPLWTSDSYAWPDAGAKPAYDYARTVNPNRDMLVALLAELEGAAGGAVTASGQAAALLALLLVPADGRVVAPTIVMAGRTGCSAGFRSRAGCAPISWI